MRMNTPWPVPAMPRVAAPSFAVEPAVEEPSFSFAEQWRAVLRRRWLIGGFTLLCSVLVALYAMQLPLIFASTATVLIESDKSKIVSIDEVYSGVSQDREHYQSQIEILRSREVARRAVEKTRLWEHPDFDPRRDRPGLLVRLKELVFGAPPPVEWTEERLADATVGRLQAAVTVEPVRLSQLVKVSVESRDRELAADLANTVAETYIEADREARYRITQQVNLWIQERLGALREKVTQSERELQDYREKHGIVSLGGSAQSLAGQQVAELMQRLVSAEVRRTELESAFRQMSAKGGDVASVPAVVSDPGVAEARRRVVAAEQKVDELAPAYGSEHARLIEARNELAAARQQYERQTRAVIDSTRREVQAAQRTEAQLRATLGQARDSVQALNRQEFELGILEREVQANRQLYEVFASRSKETNLGGGLQAAVARVVDPATAGDGPIRPNKQRLVLAALLAGLVASVGATLALERFDIRLKRPGDVEQRLHQPVLASLPTVEGDQLRSLPWLFLDQPNSVHAEAIRTARSGVLLSGMGLQGRIVLVTSSAAGEGKSTLCSNLAFAHAQTKSTLLIDADLRRPVIGRRIGLPDDAKGLTNLIDGSAELQDCIHRLPGSGLLVMPSGGIPPNPLELLLSSRFRDALLSLSTQVEVIVIDAPPVDGGTDALILSSLASSTIFVAKAMHTPYPRAAQSLQRLHRSGASVLGVVLNQVPADSVSAVYEFSGGDWQPAAARMSGATPPAQATTGVA